MNSIRLGVAGFLTLFLELALIRWLPANAVFLQFFSNIVLLSAFIGLSCGFLATSRKADWLAYVPVLLASTVLASIVLRIAFFNYAGFAVDVGNQKSPQEIFFGTEGRNLDLATFVLPLEFIAGLFFTLIALTFVGIGQMTGRLFQSSPNRLKAYGINIAGNIVGIVLFSALSNLQTPAPIWFLISFLALAYLMYADRVLTVVRGLSLVALFACMTLMNYTEAERIIWSPYYQIRYDDVRRNINADLIGHQIMVPYENSPSALALIHILQRDSGAPPFKKVLIIGAGSGNDVSYALKFGAEEIHAVEIDPAIQKLGIEHHPDQPYQDRRVIRHIDDGRHFLRSTDEKFDIVIYALVDSLINQSSLSNIRLESYLFTKDAIDDVRRVLKPEGVFVSYNFYRKGWIVQRIAGIAEAAFGCTPTTLSVPHTDILKSTDATEFNVLIAGCNSPIASAFATHGSYVMPRELRDAIKENGFAVQRPEKIDAGLAETMVLTPAKFEFDNSAAREIVTDDWPYLYTSGRLIPDITWRSALIFLAVSAIFLWRFMPTEKFVPSPRMFFLGAGFMLLETKAVVQTALVYGSTWIVNSAVFLAVLILIFIANALYMKRPIKSLSPVYALLAISLAVSYAVPISSFLDGSWIWRNVIPVIIVLGPIFFASLIFSAALDREDRSDRAMAVNIAGAMVGGLMTSLSTLLGFNNLVIVATVLYALSLLPQLSRVGSR